MKHCLSCLIYYIKFKQRKSWTWRDWISDLNKHNFYDFIVRFRFSFSFIEKIHQTHKTVFDDIYKHLEFRQKYSAARRILNSLPGDLKCGQARSLIFDISLNILFNLQILYANEAESINPVEKDKEEQQPEVSSF